MTQPIEQENITENSPNGALFGRTSTKRIAFYGATPVTRPVTASTLNVSTTSTVSTSSATVAVESWGFASEAEVSTFILAVSACQFAMKRLGITS